MSAARDASAAKAIALPPSEAMISTVSLAAAALRSAQNTCAPSRAKVTAVALPLPQPGPIEPAPTTIAVLPLRRATRPLLVFFEIGRTWARGQPMPSSPRTRGRHPSGGRHAPVLLLDRRH